MFWSRQSGTLPAFSTPLANGTDYASRSFTRATERLSGISIQERRNSFPGGLATSTLPRLSKRALPTTRQPLEAIYLIHHGSRSPSFDHINGNALLRWKKPS